MSSSLPKSLPSRGRAILKIAAAGKNSGEIGGSLGINKTTVNNYREDSQEDECLDAITSSGAADRPDQPLELRHFCSPIAY